jgi:hypothetical protein
LARTAAGESKVSESNLTISKHRPRMRAYQVVEIRELRGRMWSVVRERKHTVSKVFPAQFREARVPGEAVECECMMFGEVEYRTEDGAVEATTVPWAGHGVLRKETVGEREEWKFAQYRVWLQK